jgi:hypothetical protein
VRQPPYFAGVHRLAVESSGIGSGGRASARLPCWLNIRVARIGRGFHGLSNGCVAPRWRGNPWDARGAARGSAFGVPLTDPEEENPLYNIDAANTGDLIAGSGESWKAYLQSANGPCDDTVHGYYRNDDQPMMYFQDVRDRPRYCASRVVPLEELGSDLTNPATAPNFAWVAPDDCPDMEGCGISAGDEFLKTELTTPTRPPSR